MLLLALLRRAYGPVIHVTCKGLTTLPTAEAVVGSLTSSAVQVVAKTIKQMLAQPWDLHYRTFRPGRRVYRAALGVERFRSIVRLMGLGVFTYCRLG